MHCCCWVISPHIVDVGFHIHVGNEYYVFNYSGWLFGVITMCLLHHGVTTSEVIWYHTCLSRSRHIACLGWVIIVYVLGVNYVLGVVVCLMNSCDWWPYTCWNLLVTFWWICEDVHVLVFIMNYEILWWLIIPVYILWLWLMWS